MKVTINQLRNSSEAINQLIQTNMKASSAFKVSKISKKIEEELSIAEETRSKLVDQYGEKTDEGYSRVIEENKEEFANEIVSLFNQEVDLSINSLSITDLTDSKGNELDISPSVLMSLDWLFSEEK